MKSKLFSAVVFGFCWTLSLSASLEGIHPGYAIVDALMPGASTLSDIGPFRSDFANISGGTLAAVATTVINTNAPGCWAPMKVYQSERYNNNMTVTVRGLTPGASYITELHNSEDYSGSGVGFRIFDYYVNGVLVLDDYDIVKATGGKFTAVCNVAETTANSSGEIAFKFVASKDNARYSGLVVFGSTAPAAIDFFAVSTLAGTSDLVFSWSAAPDTFRYYIQRASSADGPWSDLGVYVPETTTATLLNVYNASEVSVWRVVASNGVGMTASEPWTFSPPSDFTDIATRGSVIPDASSDNVRIAFAGEPTAGPVTLARPITQIASLWHDFNASSLIALGEDEILRTSSVSITTNGTDLTVGDVIGRGALLPPAGKGGLTLGVLNPAATLTVNAAVSNADGVAVALIKDGPGAAFLAADSSYTGNTFLNDGMLTMTVNGTNILNGVLSGPGTLVKRGAGRLQIDRVNPLFSGNAVVEEGTLLLNIPQALPDLNGCSLTIAEGAALDVGGPSLNADAASVARRHVIVSGAGPDGKGAIINSSPTSQYNALVRGELAGDVVFGGALSGSRWDFRGVLLR